MISLGKYVLQYIIAKCKLLEQQFNKESLLYISSGPVIQSEGIQQEKQFLVLKGTFIRDLIRHIQLVVTYCHILFSNIPNIAFMQSAK